MLPSRSYPPDGDTQDSCRSLAKCGNAGVFLWGPVTLKSLTDDQLGGPLS